MADVFGEENPFSDEFSEAEEFVIFASDDNTSSTADNMGQDENCKLENDESSVGSEDSDAEPVHPLTELRKLVESDLILNRQIAARNVLDTLNEVASNEDDLHTLVSLIGYLSDDPEFVVRVETLAQVPQIAVFCREHPCDLESVIRQNLVPLTVRRLADHQNQVRKTSQQSLLALLEKGMIDNCQLTEWICPLVIQLSGNTDEEVKSEAVTFMCQMAPLVGKEISLKFFLQHIASFCIDSSYSVRQVCSVFFGDVCKVVGTEPTENILLPKFLSLCSDAVWGIRKNCAEVFMDVSSVVTSKTRNEMLPNVFVTLLCDESRWVRLGAYQALGAVIATFADPSKTGLKYCEDGTIIEVPVADESSVLERKSSEDSETSDMHTKLPEVQNKSLECPPSNFDPTDCTSRNFSTTFLSDSENNSEQTNISSRTDSMCDSSFSPGPPVLSSMVASNNAGDVVDVNNRTVQESCMQDEMADQQMETAAGDSVAASQKQSVDPNSQHTDLHGTAQGSVNTEPPPSRPRKGSGLDSPLTVVAKDGHLHLHVENESDFNNFQFWRVPIPDVELDIDIKDGRATSIHVRAKVHDEKSDKICASDLSVQIAPKDEPCTDSINVEVSQKSLSSIFSAGKLDIQTTCMNTVDTPDRRRRTTLGRISIVNSSFSEASVLLNQGELSEVKKVHSRLRLGDYDNEDSESIFRSRCRLGFVDKPVFECDKSAYEQDIVPPRLLEYYVDMVDCFQSQPTVEEDLARLCARSFPAVVYTLGRKHWPCVKRLCDALAKDEQWKVRKTIAACLHELGCMLGSEITTRDLLPVFMSFLKDLDEVRIGVLSHLPEFLRLLKPSERREFLPVAEEFVKMDNERNWRYRCVLAQKLGPIVDLFSPSDIEDHVAPIGMWLITDRVSEVRLTAARMMAMVLRRMAQTPDSKAAVDFLEKIYDKFFHSGKWHVRQMYVVLCEQCAVEKSFPHEVYVKKVIPKLFSLTNDVVPNVRIAVARCLAQTLIPSEYFPTIQRMHYQMLLQVVLALQDDNDRDVKYFAKLTSAAFAVLPPDRQ